MQAEPLLPFPNLSKIDGQFDRKSEILLHCGDSKNFLKTIPDEYVTLIITSLPYNIGKEYEVKTKIEVYLQTQSEIIKELIRVLKPNGSICWEVGNYVEDSEVFPLDIFYNEGDFVLDPYVGVGSSLVTVLKNDRCAIGVDKEPKYIEITEQRIKQLYIGNLRVRELGTLVYKPTGKEKVSQVPKEWIKYDR